MSDVPDRLWLLANEAAAPKLSEAALLERFGEPTEVVVSEGQVWRARWAKTTVLALILRVHDADVTVVPVTLDPPADDSSNLIVDGTATIFDTEATAWCNLDRVLGMRVLDRLIDRWPEPVWRSCIACVHGEDVTLPVSVRPGDGAPTAVTRHLRAELDDELRELVNAPALGSDVHVAPTKLLRDYLNITQVQAVLGVEQSDAMAILVGKRPLTSDQVGPLAAAAGATEDMIWATQQPLPSPVAAELEHPRWRPIVELWASTRKVDELQARMAIAYGSFALAARETSGPTVWRDRVKRFLETQDID
jgi:hypothetical protein